MNVIANCVVGFLALQNGPPAVPPSTSAAIGSFRPSHVEDFENGSTFGTSLAFLPDIDGDGGPDLALGDAFNPKRIGRVVLASGRSGRVLGWIDGPAGEPSFGREVATIETGKEALPCLLVARPWGKHPAIVSVDLRDFTQTDTWKADERETGFGLWFQPWNRAHDGRRTMDGIVVLSTIGEQDAEGGGVLMLDGPCRLSRYDMAGTLRAQAEIRGGMTGGEFSANPALVQGIDCDDVAVIDEDRLRLLSGKDLATRWSRPLVGKYSVRSMCSPGDLNGDGRADLVLGCPSVNCGSRLEAGVLLLVSGADGAVIREVALNGDIEHFGFAVSAGRIKGGKPASYLVSRAAAFMDAVFEYDGVDPDPQVEWKLKDDIDLPHLGWRLFAAPDLDGDGVADVVTTRASASCWALDRQGIVVFSGKTQQRLYALERKPQNP